MVLKANQNEAPPAQDSDDMTVDGCVCPQCYKPLKVPSVTDAGTNRYGIRVRDYNGFCFHCRRGCIVIQFAQDDRWLIHSFRPLRYESGTFVGFGPDWMIVNPLPEPPPVLNGPGGDYDKAPDPAYDPAISAIEAISSLMLLTTQALGNILEELTRFRNNEPNNRKH